MVTAAAPARFDPPRVRLEGRGLVLRREGRAVLDGASLQVRGGEALSVQGASGSGKSTLLRALATLVPVDEGRVFFDETDAELNARLDELKFAAAGAMFLAAMEAEVRGPDSAFESAETRARVVQALQLAMEEMEPEDREILGFLFYNDSFFRAGKFEDMTTLACFYSNWKKAAKKLKR